MRSRPSRMSVSKPTHGSGPVNTYAICHEVSTVGGIVIASPSIRERPRGERPREIRNPKHEIVAIPFIAHSSRHSSFIDQPGSLFPRIPCRALRFWALFNEGTWVTGVEGTWVT